ncbi:sugar phosphate isomerase/epimerase family protein [Algoriphagus winogradskyi]|uniref:Tat (Twin-arginine translocation) pathway signal sequence n=1 Tax=Algoriphagus winogradskyi TaxID=237017 RepID=A0ABY1NK90_9BACT|nr:sugar phosphate isomerase/epimerase [Algoriphagus winogradskyi]SMP11491.1 Tat (twin-arginine translocation) pathway signal sequence [Algoriphagus winogradskyi]
MINRRDFIKQTGLAVSAASFGLAGFNSPKAKDYKMGLQLFTIRAPMAEDPKLALKTIAGFGYQDTETYGYDGEKQEFYGMPATDFKKVLEDNSLVSTSGHYDFIKYFNGSSEDLMRYTDQSIVGAHALNQKYITWPWLDPESRSIEKFKILADKLNLIGERVNKAGLGFAYHNHDFEFIDHNGEIGYDIILQNTDPELVKLQIDLYWVAHSSPLSAHELFMKAPGRFVMWHIKDMDKVSRDYTEMGNGSIDYTKILPAASLSGMEYYYIEQGGNFAQNPIQSVKESATYFKKNLINLFA